MDFFWMVDVSPVIRALTGPKPHVIWHATYGDTTLALVNASDRMPILQKHRWLLCAGYRGELREMIGDYTDWSAADAACRQWADYLAKGGTVAAWKEHTAHQRQSEVY
jgi:hypothetical protein